MRRARLALFSLICGCSLNVPPTPQSSGLVPACNAGEVLRGGQCVALSSLKGGHAATAANATQASYAQFADVSDYADTAEQTHSIDPAVQLDIGPPGASPGLFPTPLHVLGGPMRLDLGKVFAHLASYSSDGANAVTVGSAVSASSKNVPLAGSPNTFSITHDSVVRIRANGMVQGTGDATQGTFSNCVIIVELAPTGGGPVVALPAVVSTYARDGSQTDYRPWFLQFETPLTVGSYLVTATLFIDNQTYFNNACTVNGSPENAVRVEVDGT